MKFMKRWPAPSWSWRGLVRERRGRRAEGRRVQRILLVLGLAGLVLPACGGKDTAHVVAFRATEPGPDRYGFDGPTSVQAGVLKIRLTNPGGVERSAQLLRLDPGHSVDEALKTIYEPAQPSWMHAEGGVQVVKPHHTESATVKLDAGTYYVVDLNNGNDENAPSYASKGAVHELAVTGRSTSKLPGASTVITAREYAFGIPKLKPGENTVEFRNAGREIHVLVGAPLAPGKTFDDVKASLEGDGPPPLDMASVVQATPLDGSKAEITKLDLKRGTYVFFCFFSDRSGGPPHMQLGMLQEVKVA